MDDSEQWCFTIARVQGLRLMRPEKSWRPIVTVDIDKHHHHETVLGCDGQNPNLKEVFHLRQASSSSQVDIQVYHRSQSKKKSKRRTLVASASHSLSELVKKQIKEPKNKLEIRLHCQTAAKRTIASRGKPQNGTFLHLKLHPPSHVKQQYLKDLDEEAGCVSGTDSGAESDSGSSHVSRESSKNSGSDTIAEPELSPLEGGLRRRRKKRVRGYAIDTDDDPCSSGSCSDDTGDEGRAGHKLPTFLEDDTCTYDEDDAAWGGYDDPSAIRQPEGVVSVCIGTGEGWLAPSLLPVYTEKIEVPPELTFIERALASFTMYSELKAATHDSHYDKVFTRLQLEWTYTGGLLVALAAVNTAVFSISPESIFIVGSYARIAIAGSSIASGLGIACDAWFLLRYNWADLETFRTRARDVYDSYFFFSLSARVPAICMFLSAVALMGFLGLVAFDAWPQGVVGVCFVVGVVMSLQFLVYGVHRAGGLVLEGGRRGRRGVGWVVRGVRGGV